MKHFDLLQRYLANLGVLNVKLHNVHWNVVGPQFMEVHNFTESLYDKFFEDFDAVAEALKMRNEMPLSTMAEYLEKSDLKEIKAKPFSSKETLELVKEDLTSMKKLAIEIRNLADEEGDFTAVGMFEEYVGFYEKNLWFLNSILG